jgi:hypothetical protein
MTDRARTRVRTRARPVEQFPSCPTSIAVLAKTRESCAYFWALFNAQHCDRFRLPRRSLRLPSRSQHPSAGVRRGRRHAPKEVRASNGFPKRPIAEFPRHSQSLEASKKARAQFHPAWGAMRTIRPNSARAWVWPAGQPHGLGRMQSWLSSRLGREKWKSGEFPVNAGKPLIERVKPRYIQDYRYCRRNFCRGIPRL